jgi:hypothetical protein
MKHIKLLSTVVLAGLSLTAFADDSQATVQQQAQLNSLSAQISQLQAQQKPGATVGSVLGNNVMFDTDDPFGMMSDTNFNLQILQARQSSGFNKPVVLGAYLEADPQVWWGSLNVPGATPGSSVYNNGSSLYLTTAKLYTLGNINNWVSTFFSLQPATTRFSTTFDQAFITFGDLSKNPLFLTIGRSYLPFGTFAGNGPWSNSITTNAFRTSMTNQINLGFYQNGLTLNFALANSGTNAQNISYDNNISDFVYNVYYTKSYANSFNYSVGASYLSDIRGLTNDVGGAYAAGNLTGGKNGAYDVNGSIGYKQFILNAEYVSTVNSATNANGTSNGIMSSWMTTLSYAPVLAGKITTFSIGYSGSNNMANVPYNLSGSFNTSPFTAQGQGFRNQWIAFVQRPVLFKNMYISPEIDYAQTYNNQDTWTGTVDISVYF